MIDSFAMSPLWDFSESPLYERNMGFTPPSPGLRKVSLNELGTILPVVDIGAAKYYPLSGNMNASGRWITESSDGHFLARILEHSIDGFINYYNIFGLGPLAPPNQYLPYGPYSFVSAVRSDTGVVVTPYGNVNVGAYNGKIEITGPASGTLVQEEAADGLTTSPYEFNPDNFTTGWQNLQYVTLAKGKKFEFSVDSGRPWYFAEFFDNGVNLDDGGFSGVFPDAGRATFFFGLTPDQIPIYGGLTGASVIGPKLNQYHGLYNSRGFEIFPG